MKKTPEFFKDVGNASKDTLKTAGQVIIAVGATALAVSLIKNHINLFKSGA